MPPDLEASLAIPLSCGAAWETGTESRAEGSHPSSAGVGTELEGELGSGINDERGRGKG